MQANSLSNMPSLLFACNSIKGWEWAGGGHPAGVSGCDIISLYQFVNKDKILHLIEIGASKEFSLEELEKQLTILCMVTLSPFPL